MQIFKSAYTQCGTVKAYFVPYSLTLVSALTPNCTEQQVLQKNERQQLGLDPQWMSHEEAMLRLEFLSRLCRLLLRLVLSSLQGTEFKVQGTKVPWCPSSRTWVTKTLGLVGAAILDYWLKIKVVRGCVPSLSGWIKRHNYLTGSVRLSWNQGESDSSTSCSNLT